MHYLPNIHSTLSDFVLETINDLHKLKQYFLWRFWIYQMKKRIIRHTGISRAWHTTNSCRGLFWLTGLLILLIVKHNRNKWVRLDSLSIGVWLIKTKKKRGGRIKKSQVLPHQSPSFPLSLNDIIPFFEVSFITLRFGDKRERKKLDKRDFKYFLISFDFCLKLFFFKKTIPRRLSLSNGEESKKKHLLPIAARAPPWIIEKVSFLFSLFPDHQSGSLGHECF